MSAGLPPETVPPGSPSFFKRLNEKSLRDDLRFFFATVGITSLFVTGLIFIVLPILARPDELGIGLDQIWDLGLYIIATLSIGLVQGILLWTIVLLGISLIEHFFLLFVDVHQGFEKTMKSAIYALPPCILLFWAAKLFDLPYVSFLLLFCLGLTTYLGVRTFHEMSKDRALFAALATGVVLAILLQRWIFADLALLLELIP